MDRGARLQLLRALGAAPDAAGELLRYNDNAFAVPARLPAFPLPDEPFVAVWEEYARDAAVRGAAAALRDRLPQLRFPIAEGISESAAYQAATRRGVMPPEGEPGLALEAPERVTLFLHPTPAGRIPVLLVEHRPDFEALVRALLRRNEPAHVAASQGAAMIAGYNNWDRVGRLRAAFEAGELRPEGARSWEEALRALSGRKELYQDSFILLSGGPYSGVPAERLGLADDEWRRLSITIRLEHECAHYFTRRVFGSMRNTLLDELIADYAGITAAAGEYREDWFLHFLGLEDPTAYREGGRMEIYRGTPPLSGGAFAALQALVRRAARTVSRADEAVTAACADPRAARARLMAALASFTLEELAADDAAGLLIRCIDATAGTTEAKPVSIG